MRFGMFWIGKRTTITCTLPVRSLGNPHEIQGEKLMTDHKQESTGSGRSPVIIIGGTLILVGAFVVLLFGGVLVGDDLVGDEDIVEEQPAVVAETISTAIQLPENGPPLQVGDQPYEFALQDLDGNTVTLSQFIGRPVLINFWATWCGPCRIEMPELQSVFEEYGSSEDFLILALDQDESAEDVRAYFDELGLTFQPLLDEDNQTARNYGLQGTLPASVFINPDGEVTVIHRGVMTRGQIDAFLVETIPNKSMVDAGS
jgi:peroxiredoxin